MVGFFKSFNMKEAEAISGFDPEGIFVAHMVSINYASIFNKVQEISEGGDNNEDSRVKAKVTTTPRKIITKKKKQPAHEDAHTRVSSNIGAVEVSPLEGNKQPQHRQRGRSTTNIEGGIAHHPHKSPSSGHKDQEISVGGKENNQGCVGDGDGGDPP
jgi:hypothetical protein